jgi:hypothetical protein
VFNGEFTTRKTTMQGYITHWNKERHFGFIARKIAGGWLEKYFALESSIIRREVEPDIDVIVEFDVSTAPPRKIGGYPLAMNVQVLAPKPAEAEVRP